MSAPIVRYRKVGPSCATPASLFLTRIEQTIWMNGATGSKFSISHDFSNRRNYLLLLFYVFFSFFISFHRTNFGSNLSPFFFFFYFWNDDLSDRIAQIRIIARNRYRSSKEGGREEKSSGRKRFSTFRTLLKKMAIYHTKGRYSMLTALAWFNTLLSLPSYKRFLK